MLNENNFGAEVVRCIFASIGVKSGVEETEMHIFLFFSSSSSPLCFTILAWIPALLMQAEEDLDHATTELVKSNNEDWS